jgi:hypothetical protein
MAKVAERLLYPKPWLLDDERQEEQPRINLISRQEKAIEQHREFRAQRPTTGTELGTARHGDHMIHSVGWLPDLVGSPVSNHSDLGSAISRL